MSQIETIVPAPVPSTHDFDKNLQMFAQKMVTDLKIPEHPSNTFSFKLCIKKSFSNPNGILECVAQTHLKIHGYLASDLRSDAVRVLEELPEKHWLIFHYADKKNIPAGRQRRLSFSTDNPVDDRYYWSTGCAQFALEKNRMGASIEVPVPYKYIDNTWTKLSGCILTPLATTTWIDIRSGKPVLEDGFLFG